MISIKNNGHSPIFGGANHMNQEKFDKFSVPLGLLDYINPIFYSITIITIMKNIGLAEPFHTLMMIGAVLSIFFGFIIPTGKVMVGLGLIKFKMPVSLVFCVNTGILLSGLVFFQFVMNLNLLPLLAILFVIVFLLF